MIKISKSNSLILKEPLMQMRRATKYLFKDLMEMKMLAEKNSIRYKIKIEELINRWPIKMNFQADNILWIRFDLTVFLTTMEIPYILLSNKEVMNKYKFLEVDHRIIKMWELTRSLFNPIKDMKFPTLRERGISRGYLKWILKSLIIYTTLMRIISY